MKPHLVVMAKEPRAGRVKTRLAAAIGGVTAVSFYRHGLSNMLARVDRPREWETVVALSPDTAQHSRALTARVTRWRQGRGDLGQRMQRVFDRKVSGPFVIIGSDIPGINARHIRAAFQALGNHDAVLGPAPDGGYWLIGLKRFPRILRPFENVRWSGPDARSDTTRNLRGNRVALLTELADIDTARDLMGLGAARGRRIWPMPGPASEQPSRGLQ